MIIDNSVELDSLFEWLQAKYPVSEKCEVMYELEDVGSYTGENGEQFFGQANEIEGLVFILIALRAPFNLLHILAHEYCHVLQMYIWNTFPPNLTQPSFDQPLEIQADDFAKLEVEAFHAR